MVRHMQYESFARDLAHPECVPHRAGPADDIPPIRGNGDRQGLDVFEIFFRGVAAKLMRSWHDPRRTCCNGVSVRGDNAAGEHIVMREGSIIKLAP